MYGFYGLTAFLFVAALATADVAEIGRLQRTAEVVDVRTGSMCWVHKGQFIYVSHEYRERQGLTYSRTHTAVRLLGVGTRQDDCGFRTAMTLPNEFFRPTEQ